MICIIRARFTKTKAFGVVCLATMTLLLPLQAQDRSPKVQQLEGKLTLHQDLPVGLVSGTTEHPQLVEVKSIRFETTYGNAWRITARVGWSPVSDAIWRLTIELLDEKGHVLRNSRDEATVFTCKAGGQGEADMLYADLNLDPMQYQGRRHATRFRVRLEPSEEQVRTAQTADLKRHTLEVMVVDQESQAPMDIKVLGSVDNLDINEYASLLTIAHGLSFHIAENPEYFTPKEVPPLPPPPAKPEDDYKPFGHWW